MKKYYPTKQEVLNMDIIISTKEISTLKKWKKQVWSKVIKGSKQQKVEALTKLISSMAKLYKLKINVRYNSDIPTAYYDPLNIEITLNNESIVTAIHELGHAIFGPSELKACAFSVQLFKKVFPKAYKKLKWRGHMLVK